MACGYPSRFPVVRQITSIKRQMEIKLSVLHVSEGEKAWPYTILATCHDALLHSYTRDDETGLRGREGGNAGTWYTEWYCWIQGRRHRQQNSKYHTGRQMMTPDDS